MTDYARPLPRLDDANAPFWAGAREREVRLQRCAACGTLRFPAARYCAACGSDASDWAAVSGRGTVEAWCRFHKPYFEGFADAVPYTVILVRLEEGPRLFSNPADDAADGMSIGTPVEACFENVTPDVTLIKFRPAG